MKNRGLAAPEKGGDASILLPLPFVHSTELPLNVLGTCAPRVVDLWVRAEGAGLVACLWVSGNGRF